MLPPESNNLPENAAKIVDGKQRNPDDKTSNTPSTTEDRVQIGVAKEPGSQNGVSEVTPTTGRGRDGHLEGAPDVDVSEKAAASGEPLVDLWNEKTDVDIAENEPKGKQPAVHTPLLFEFDADGPKIIGDMESATTPQTGPTSSPRGALGGAGLDTALIPAMEGLQSLKINAQSASDTDEAERASMGGARRTAEDAPDNDSRSEIASIMEQFQDGMGGPGEDEIMSPRLELASPLLSPAGHHPPRKSSLEALHHTPSRESFTHSLNSPPPRTSSLHGPAGPSNASIHSIQTQERSSSPRPPSLIFKPPPPEPDPEPDLPFDFHRFLEQLRHRTADPVAKFLRSFLIEFGKRSWAVHEQVKIISDFLAFITKKMAQCEVWRTVSDAEFDNAREGMEKLVMNRLYTQTFSPEIPPPEVVKRGRREEFVGGRRGQHQEDVERDEVLAQKVRIYGWVKEEHLDIKPVGDKGRKFLKLAQTELLKIKSYRAPRDKVICVLNCCKVIFGFLRDSKSDQSADAFVPLLIYVVLHANPDHLVSNVQYILRFRNSDKLTGEAGYYISSLMGAIQFIENLDRTSLTITDEDFEANVEAAVKEIAERHSAILPDNAPATDSERQRNQFLQSPSKNSRRAPSPHILINEKSTLSRPEVTPRNSLDAERSVPRRSPSTRASRESDRESEENPAVAGLLRTIQRPLSSIGRMFSDPDALSSTIPSSPPKQPAHTPRNLSQAPNLSQPLPPLPPQDVPSADTRRREHENEQIRQMAAEDAAVRQASVEAEEVRRVQRREFDTVVETLSGMFPGLDREVIGDVVRGKDGNVGLAVDACLALSTS